MSDLENFDGVRDALDVACEKLLREDEGLALAFREGMCAAGIAWQLALLPQMRKGYETSEMASLMVYGCSLMAMEALEAHDEIEALELGRLEEEVEKGNQRLNDK